MNRKYILAALIAVTAGTLVYIYGGSNVPEGQPPLHDLTTQNLTDIETAFNVAKDNVRALLLMSPT